MPAVTFSQDAPPLDHAQDLYRSVGWLVYLTPGRLSACIEGSTWLEAAWAPPEADSDQAPALVGLIRVISDDASIAYVQDLLVHPDHQRQGIGTRLMGDALARFEHVRQLVLVTDDAAPARAFYESLGLGTVSTQHCVAYMRVGA